MRRIASTVSALTAALVLTACGSSAGPAGGGPSAAQGGSGGPAGAAQDAVTGTVAVFAAASLKESFTQLASRFEAAHPGVRVALNFGPSSGLSAQINQGAPADVFASASATTMDQVVAAGGAAGPMTFARNAMMVAVPPSNPGRVSRLTDLARPDVKVAVCQAAVPCGIVAATVFANARITVKPVTEEADVKAVLTKVTLGEVDAGVVYVTDVQSAGAKATGVPITAEVNASTAYPIASLTRAANPVAARAFTEYVLTAEAASVLTAGGFSRP